jgi:hypothetical protein
LGVAVVDRRRWAQRMAADGDGTLRAKKKGKEKRESKKFFIS